MSLKELFKQNPFKNLIVAGEATSEFPLRGHEDLLDRRFHEISQAIENPQYPANAQHTIVFGEWGHGKTHVLRILQHKINTCFPNRAKAVFFEPTEFTPKGILQELCNILNVKANNLREFIEHIEKSYPENLFLLIDETQSLVGETLSDNYINQLKDYWTFLHDLQQEASNKMYGLHIFHGLSANSASAIHRVGQIPAIKQFKRQIFSLKSLDEEAQWQMFCDHINKALINNEIDPETIINRGVSRCINKMTGGSPRFALALMAQIFSKAQYMGADKIDGSICYQTLCETQRLDSSGDYYFDSLAIKDIIEQLRNGLQFEQKIAEFLHQQLGLLLGEWSDIDQTILAQYNLTTTIIRKQCDSLKKPIKIFDQPLGQSTFRLTHDFLRQIRVSTRNTLNEVEDKELLLSLQLEPESKVPYMITGMQKIMLENKYHGFPRELDTSIPLKIFITNLKGSHLAQMIKIGIIVFKGDEVPIDVFEKIIEEIETDRCTVIIVIEDTHIRHDFAGSTYEKFKGKYNGNIDVEKRILFINGTDQQGQQFDEDFFVRLVKKNIQPDEAKEWFDRLQISRRLEKVEDDCIYCPDLNEQTLLYQLFKEDRSFNISEIKGLNENFAWVNRARLDNLGLYLNKDGASYKTYEVEQIGPFKFILSKLQGVETGLTLSEIENQIVARYIRTGSPPAIQAYVKWFLEILIDNNKVAIFDERYLFKDLDREIMQLKKDYETLCKAIDKTISQYLTAQIEEEELTEIRQEVDEIYSRIKDVSLIDKIALQIEEYKDGIKRLNIIIPRLENIPDLARKTLNNQYSETQSKYKKIEQDANWPYQDMVNPYERLYQLDKIDYQLKALESKITEKIPLQGVCRQQLRELNEQLIGLGELLEGKMEPGNYEDQKDISKCIFDIFNAIKDGRTGKITLYFE